jgi:hypothetical protein
MNAKTELFEIMRTSLRRDPRASRRESLGYFLEEMQRDPKYLVALAEHYFYGNYDRFDVEQIGVGHAVVVPKPVKSREQRIRESADRAMPALSNIKQLVRSVVFLDIELPNGKRLRHATFADCAKAGGWYADIAKRGKPSEAVDKNLTETDLQNIWKRFEKAT